MSKAKRIQVRHRATDCSSHVPLGIQMSQNLKRQIWKVIIGRQNKVHRRHLDATSATIPMRKHRETESQ